MGKVIWPPEKVKEMVSLYNQGLSGDEIAVRMNITGGSVRNQLKYCGVSKRPRISKELDHKIITLKNLGMSCSEIAEVLDKDYNWINKRLFELKRRMKNE